MKFCFFLLSERHCLFVIFIVWIASVRIILRSFFSSLGVSSFCTFCFPLIFGSENKQSLLTFSLHLSPAFLPRLTEHTGQIWTQQRDTRWQRPCRPRNHVYPVRKSSRWPWQNGSTSCRTKFSTLSIFPLHPPCP